MRPFLQFVALFVVSTVACQVCAADQPTYLMAPSDDYVSIGVFHDGLLKVATDDNHSGYINTAGELVIRIAQNFDTLGNFHEGRAFIGKQTEHGTRYGFIDQQGKTVIPCIYKNVENFADGRAFVKQGDKWSVIDKQGNVVIEPRNWSFTYLEEDSNPDSGLYTLPSAFYSGRSRVEKEHLYGFIDTDGKLVIDYQYEQALHFKNGYALVAFNPQHHRPATATNPYEVGSIDWLKYKIEHRTLSQTQASQAHRIWRLIDTQGNTLYEFTGNQKPDAAHFHKGQYVAFKLSTGTPDELNPPQGVMDRHGNIIIPAKKRNQSFHAFSDGLSILPVRGQRDDNSDGYMWIIDATANTRYKVPFCWKTRCMVDTTHAFHDGLLGVRVNLDPEYKTFAWGYIDKKGNWIIAPQFNDVVSFHEGIAAVETFEGKVGLIKNPL